MLLVLTTYLNLLFFISKDEKRELLMFGFSYYLFFVVYISAFISFGFFSIGKTFFLFSSNLIILYGFLLIIEKLFKSTVLAAVIVMLFQLAGGGLTYLFEFSDMLSKKIAVIILCLYGVVPVYQKISFILQNNSFKLLLPDLIIAVIVVSYKFFTKPKHE
jgi:hypothetical protein